MRHKKGDEIDKEEAKEFSELRDFYADQEKAGKILIERDDYARATFALQYAQHKGWEGSYTDEQVVEAMNYVFDIKKKFEEAETGSALWAEAVKSGPIIDAAAPARASWRNQARNYVVRPWDDPEILRILWQERGKQTKSNMKSYIMNWRKAVAALEGCGSGISKAREGESIWAKKIIDGLSIHTALTISTFRELAAFGQGKTANRFVLSTFRELKLVSLRNHAAPTQVVLWSAEDHPYETNSVNDVVVDVEKLKGHLTLKLSSEKKEEA